MQGFTCSNALAAKDCTASNGGNFEIRISFSSCLRPQPRSRRRQGSPTGSVAQLGPVALRSLDQDPNAVFRWSPSMLWSRNWPTGSAVTDHSIEAVSDFPGLSPLCKSETGFQFPATTLDFLRIPTQGIALS